MGHKRICSITSFINIKVMIQIWLLVNAKIQSNNRLLMPEVSIKKNSKMKSVSPNVLTKDSIWKDYLTVANFRGTRRASIIEVVHILPTKRLDFQFLVFNRYCRNITKFSRCRQRRTWFVACMWETRCAQRILIGDAEGKRQLGRLKSSSKLYRRITETRPVSTQNPPFISPLHLKWHLLV